MNVRIREGRQHRNIRLQRSTTVNLEHAVCAVRRSQRATQGVDCQDLEDAGDLSIEQIDDADYRTGQVAIVCISNFKRTARR